MMQSYGHQIVFSFELGIKKNKQNLTGPLIYLSKYAIFSTTVKIFNINHTNHSKRKRQSKNISLRSISLIIQIMFSSREYLVLQVPHQKVAQTFPNIFLTFPYIFPTFSDISQHFLTNFLIRKICRENMAKISLSQIFFRQKIRMIS